jgi:sec-independent protein translocase protein TatB
MQRYVADVKSEVNRSIELEELKKMKDQFADAARNVEQTVSNEIHQTSSDLRDSVDGSGGSAGDSPSPDINRYDTLLTPLPAYRNPKKQWRLKRSAMPQWYKQRHGIRGKAQSGAARVARFRPPRSSA